MLQKNINKTLIGLEDEDDQIVREQFPVFFCWKFSVSCDKHN